MPLFNRLLLIILFIFSTLTTSAQYAELSGNPASRAQLTTAVEQIYNFQPTTADATLAALGRTNPDHPVIELLQAVNLYWQWFPARTNKTQEQRIRALLQIASKASEKWMAASKGNQNPEAMYAYFSAQALLAKLDNFAHANFGAAGHAKNAYPYIKRCNDYQQQYPDFYMVSGLYNYLREKYPEIHPFYKTVVWVMRSGNKELGLKQLGVAAQQSLFSKAEAGFYLGHILLDYEKKPLAALPILQQTAQMYPNNLYMNAKYADALLAADRPAQALPIIARLRASSDATYRLFGQLYQARYDLLAGKLTEAQTGATAVLRANPTDETLLAWANVVLARISQRQGQTKPARAYYKTAIDLSEYPLLRDEANAYLDSH